MEVLFDIPSNMEYINEFLNPALSTAVKNSFFFAMENCPDNFEVCTFAIHRLYILVFRRKTISPKVDVLNIFCGP